MPRTRSPLTLALALSLSVTTVTGQPARAEVPANAPAVSQWSTLLFENDAFGVIQKSDNDYTNGVAFDWGDGGYQHFADIDMPGFVRALFDWTYLNADDSGEYALDYSVAQGMFTPEDLSATELIEDDRPYAGTLVWKTRLRHYGDNVSHSLGLSLGMAGPVSGAEQAQKSIHELIQAETPNGWHNQIGNEPVFRIEGEYLNRFFDHALADAFSFDTNLYTQAGIGNLKSNVGAGLVARLGDSLDHTYAYLSPLATRGSSQVRAAANDYSWQVQLAVYGQYVFNDITYDGNTFKDSHSVELIHDQYIVSLGLSMRWGNWGFDFSTQQGSKQYTLQESKSNFGSAGFTYHY